MPIEDKKLARIFQRAKLFSRKDITSHSEAAAEKDLTLYDYLIANDLASESELDQAIAKSLKVKYINLSIQKIPEKVVELLPEVVAKRNKAIAFKRDTEGLHIAISDPENQEFINNFEKRIDDSLVVYFANESAISKKITDVYHTKNEEFTDLIDSIIDGDKVTVQAEDLPIIKIVDKLLELSYLNKASDIHIEPFEKRTVIRFRIDGLLHDIVVIPIALHDLIVTRIKIMARLRTDEHRAAQDGKLRFKHNDISVDVRVSLVPVVYGEKAVMRLLYERTKQYEIEKLGYRKQDLAKIKRNIKRPWGMILSAGPTGSGKTTTLYSVIKKLNKREVNISTIEDPVEYDMEGVNQIQVNKKSGLTFSAGLRSIVRQDPDIIMVGEIRDKETAKIAINSAMTGHLVLSTIHTNDSATTLPRLIEMGVQPFLIASTINLVIAQRLVRKICLKCKKQVTLNKEMAELAEQDLSKELVTKYKLTDSKTKIYTGEGCEACQQTGYNGRVGIFEVFEMSDPIKKLLMNKANATEIEQQAITEGMITMIEDGVIKVLAGETSLEELLRVVQE